MRLKVLGCSGADFPGHHLSGFLLDQKILFDAGSLTYVLGEKDQMKIENIFITHAHLDHIIGIPFLADNIIVGRHRSRINIFAIPSVVKTIKRALLNSAVWPDFTEIPNIEESILNLIELKTGHSIQIDEFTITSCQVHHTVPAVGYLVVNREGRRFFYTGDAGPSDDTWKELKDRKIDCLIIDVSFPNRMKDLALRAGHLTPALLKEELLKIEPTPGNIYVTHIKPQYYKTIQTELRNLRIHNLRVLEDGQTIRV
jgi:ribonuclease BN (tRNA processing enzyme)